MKENYPYKYDFIPQVEIMGYSEKFPTDEKYRYALYEKMVPVGQYMATDFGFYDRILKKALPLSGRASSIAFTTFKPIINSIVEKQGKK
jgi:hypothetical protein